MELSSEHHLKKLLTLENDEIILEEIRSSGKTMALCHGVFDLIHPGHIQHFSAAKKLVDVLIVSITADEFVNKGPGRPLFDQETRIASLSALVDVDYVAISYSPTAIQVIDQIKPDLYIKGSDYSNEDDDVTGMISLERQHVEQNGGKIHFTNEITSSSSSLINKFYSSFSTTAQEWVKGFKENNGYKETITWLDKIQSLKITIIGETIVDQYTYCDPLAKSSKDPILAFQLGRSSMYPGGVLAIANNCQGWASKVSVLSFVGKDANDYSDVFGMINKKIELNLIRTDDRPTILKHRFVDKNSDTRVFEFYNFENDDLPDIATAELEILINKASANSDILIAADYGHGLFSPQIIENITKQKPFLAVNTQSNAGNRGYNTISKYSRADFVCLNSGELQLEMRSRNPDYFVIIPQILKRINAKYAAVTLGGEGLVVFDNLGNHAKVPAFATKVVDKVGAGDAVLAISSMLASVGAPVKVIGFLANLIAAHEVSQLGHQTSLALSDIKKHAKAILG
jgi:rfaE bifunctional protein kinase chain/domain/rfaE bifunctional protein nucleotidyltransferase chain/domain